MIKAKLLVGLAALAAALLVSIAPAGAWFEANSNTTSGKIKTFPEKSVFESEAGSGAAVECKSASGEPAGEWAIQVKQQRANGTQEQTKTGPHELLQIKKWGSCFGPILTAAKVKCSLQPEQQEKNTAKPQSAVGAVYPPGCEVEIAGCIIKVPAVQENRQLSEVKLENIGTNEVGIGSEVKGITSEVNETCKKTFGINGGKTGLFKTSGNLVTEGQKLI